MIDLWDLAQSANLTDKELEALRVRKRSPLSLRALSCGEDSLAVSSLTTRPTWLHFPSHLRGTWWFRGGAGLWRGFGSFVSVHV